MVEYIEKRKPWESMFSRLLVVDDQGLEHWFDFSNPVKRGGTATSSHPFLKLSSKNPVHAPF